ncbi:MAG: 30S ribosomal protein S9 [Candidatus Kaiserbacteria bacterium]|nr:30S ribosomal protein S9 [Candidatus Kaiserbacteria bacterium]
MLENQIERGGYIETVGRRKTAVARVRISKLARGIVVNGKPIEQYLPTQELVKTAMQPFHEKEAYKEFLGATVIVKGGGSSAQAEAIRHALTRAFVAHEPTDRKFFKDLGFLTRDQRKKERKKFGLKKARRAPQWSKR